MERMGNTTKDGVWLDRTNRVYIILIYIAVATPK
jgi:hypothetical protein